MGILVALALSIVLDGRLIESSEPAVLDRGTVAVPLDPYVRQLADRITIDTSTGTAQLERGEHRVTVTLGMRTMRADASFEMLPIAPYLRDGQFIIPLATIARALGASVDYDRAQGIVSIVSPPSEPVATMTPYVPQEPLPQPRPTFTPTAAPAPRPTVSGIPEPRRTPVKVFTDPS